jgi:SAM-dependent methyltransferase
VTADIHADVRNYYAAKVLRYGATPLGVDWTCAPTQQLRFVQLLKLIPRGMDFSVNDIGCGYGALVGFLHRRRRGVAIDYLGIDLSPEMIAHARRHNRRPSASFETGCTAPRVADYCLASGIFNVRLQHSQAAWTRFVQSTLEDIANASRLGFAVNFLGHAPSASAGPRELYRTDPLAWAGYCERRFGVTPAIVANYGLDEFTLLVPASR